MSPRTVMPTQEASAVSSSTCMRKVEMHHLKETTLIHHSLIPLTHHQVIPYIKLESLVTGLCWR